MRNKKDFWVEMAVREIWTQAKFARIAFNNINIKKVESNDILFSSIHSFLSHAANMSKLLKSKDNISRKTIGDVLSISKSSIIHNRDFRNHLEHYDERLKNWIDKYPDNVNVGTYNIAPRGAIKGNILFVSHYDPDSNTYIFVDEEFNLDDLQKEILNIMQTADSWVEKFEGGIIKSPLI